MLVGQKIKETLKDLKAQLNIVQKEASSLIKRIDEKMQKYQMIEKEVIEKNLIKNLKMLSMND